LQADLTRSFVHRDVLRLIRAGVKISDPEATETQVLTHYLNWIVSLQGKYKTSLVEDRALLTKVEGMD